MQTYIINTTNNKTFNSNLLFELVADNEIKWMQSSLEDIRDRVDEIFALQNRLNADEYRVAVVVDLYDFPRTRTCGKDNENAGDYAEVYKSILSIYLSNSVDEYLKRKHVAPKEFTIHFIQYVESSALHRNWAEDEEVATAIHSATNQKKLFICYGTDDDIEIDGDNNRVYKEKDDENNRVYIASDVEKEPVEWFEQEMSALRNKYLDTHTYTVVDENPVRAAFNSLSLLLLLVYRYGRKEENIGNNENLVFRGFAGINEKELEKSLQQSLANIRRAKDIAKEKDETYFSLEFDASKIFGIVKKEEIKTTEDATVKKQREHNVEKISRTDGKESEWEEQYKRIEELIYISENKEASHKELDEVIKKYLNERDSLRIDVENKFEFAYKNGGILNKQNECSSIGDLEDRIKTENANLEELMNQVFSIEAINLPDYYTELKNAKAEYDKLKKLEKEKGKSLLSFYITSFFKRKKIRDAKFKLEEAYQKAEANHQKYLELLKERYESTLLTIEKEKGVIQFIEYIHKVNIQRDKNRNDHLVMLEEVENELITILNKLGINTSNILDVDSVDVEFDISKPVSENMVYRVFTIDAIERMLNEEDR